MKYDIYFISNVGNLKIRVFILVYYEDLKYEMVWNVIDRWNLFNVLSGVLLYCCMDKYSKIDS